MSLLKGVKDTLPRFAGTTHACELPSNLAMLLKNQIAPAELVLLGGAIALDWNATEPPQSGPIPVTLGRMV